MRATWPKALAVGAILAAAMILPALVKGAPLIADLSEHRIKISTGFTGTDVLLFGATDGPGDVIVVVRGPKTRTVVRRKDRVAGVWVNGAELTFTDAPAFYAIASSAPIETLIDKQVRKREQIGLDDFEFSVAESEAEQAMKDTFKLALIRNKARDHLFHPTTRKVIFLGGQLFKTEITFPANVPTGSYLVGVFLIRDGNVVSAQTTPLFVTKVGFGAEVFDFAHRHSAWYGLIAIAVALIAGWLASAVFRRI